MGKETVAAVEMTDSVVFQALQDEIVILNMDNQEYYGLDSVGADAWRLLLEHKNVSEAAKRLHDMYDVDEETARNDLEDLVSELLRAGLLKESEEAPSQCEL
jgi:hypothetical protein